MDRNNVSFIIATRAFDYENQTKQEAKKHTAKQTECAPVEVYLHLCEHKVKYHSFPLPVRKRRRS
jgi:hypothetical protein